MKVSFQSYIWIRQKWNDQQGRSYFLAADFNVVPDIQICNSLLLHHVFFPANILCARWTSLIYWKRCRSIWFTKEDLENECWTEGTSCWSKVWLLICTLWLLWVQLCTC